MSNRRLSKTNKPKKPKVVTRHDKQSKTDAQTAQQPVSIAELPELPRNQSLRRSQLLSLQSMVGNRLTQRLLQRQGASKPIAIRHRTGGTTPAILRQTTRERDTLPNNAPNAATLAAKDFPHIKLPSDQIAILQKVLDARLAIKKGKKKLGALNVTVMQGRPQGASDQVRDYERISGELSPHYDVLHLNKALYISSSLILGDDILSKSKKDRPAIIAFRESLYKTVIAQKTKLPIAKGLKPSPVFDGLEWGVGRWELSHKGGKVGFDDLMRKQKWNLAYQSALLGEQIELTKQLEDMSRELGGKLVNATGKKLGETYGHVYNTSIKVGQELGPMGGYYDDPEGRLELSQAYLKARGARCVIRGPDNWLHLFALDKFTSSDMKGAMGDDHVYLLTKTGQVTAERVTTSDGFELTHESGKTGTGWRMKQILGEVEQFAVGAFFGDVVEDPSVTMTVGQIIIGCIPIVGQIADARDVVAGMYKMWKTGGKDGKLQTMLAMVGFVPFFGDAVKSAKKAFAKGGREAAKEAFAKTIREGVSEATDSLARKIIKDPAEVASLLKIPQKQLSELSELGSDALAQGGKAADKYAKEMTKYFDTVEGNAAALVVIGGGKWSVVAKALATSPGGEALGKKMQTWRVQQFESLSKRIDQKAANFGPDIVSGKPKMVRTGTDSYLSDVDVSFMGPHSTVHRNAAMREMEQKYGYGWRDMLHADIFADPSRLHKFDDPLAKIGGKTARDAEKRIVSEAELNVLAKMLQSGADMKQVAKTAKDLGIDMALVTGRQKELAKLSTDYLANMLRQKTPRAQVEEMARKMGVTMEAVDAYLKSGKDIYRTLELKLDVLHKRFDKAKGNPAKQAEIAEEMAVIQGKLNAAVQGPYMTPGGASKHVTRREMEMRGKVAHTAMSPALGYTALLDDFYMLQHALHDVGAEFTEDQAKSMAKYGDRLLVSAGQFGVDLTKKNTRTLWEEIARILERARIEKQKPNLTLLQPKLSSAKTALEGQLNDLSKAVKKNADDYLASTKKGKKPARADLKAIRKMLTRSEQVIAKQIALILRIELRRSDKDKKQSN
jgi:hypothetical protein